MILRRIVFLVLMVTYLFANTLNQSIQDISVKNKIIYFTYMGNWGYNGKMFFRGRTTLPLIKKRLEKTKIDILFYYKVFHNCLPHKVEQYYFKTNKLKMIYWFNKNSINTHVRKYSNESYVDCNKTYLQRKNYNINTEVCNDGSKTITFFDEFGAKYSSYYKNDKLYKKDIYKGDKVYREINGTLVFTGEYYEIDNDPLHIPSLDDYPWCDNSIKK